MDEPAGAAASTDDVEALRDRLAALEEEHATLEAELVAFHAEYMRELGVMAELDEARARWLRAVAEGSNSATDAAAADAAEERARRSTADVEAVPEAAGPPPTADLKGLFRAAAKRMHPDLAPDADAREHSEAFMKRLTQAYRDGDAETMRDLLRQWEAGGHAVAAGEASALQAAIARAERRLAEARAAPLARLLEDVMAAAARGEGLLTRMRADAEAQLAEARAALAAL